MKRLLSIKKKLEERNYDSLEGFQFLIENAKSYESIDVAFVLGINPKKSDQVVKGIVDNVPSGLGKKISVAVLTKNITDNLSNIADFIGFEDLVNKIKKEELNADVYLTTSNNLPELAKLGIARILKGKMPSIKNGTVVEKEEDLEKAIKIQKFGQIKFRSNEKIVHASIGRANFTKEQLNANYKAFYDQIISAKPSMIKPHEYIKKIYISSTMSPSIKLNNEGAKNA